MIAMSDKMINVQSGKLGSVPLMAFMASGRDMFMVVMAFQL